MAQVGTLIRLALFGSPVSASRSPWIHRRFARQCTLGIDYHAIDTGAGGLAEALARFRDAGGSGCNITVPLKSEAMRLAAQCSGEVQRAGAANTLTWQSSGWRADSTDGDGLLWDLETAGVTLRSRRIGILGAGGAAASILATLLAAGPAGITVFNRTLQRAEQLAVSHADLGSIEVQKPGSNAGTGPFDLVINATSQGHLGQAPPLEAGQFAPGALCYDLNYGAAAQPLRAWCLAKGLPYRDGLGMLVGQAAESFRIWTGIRPDARAVLDELRSSV